MGDTVFAFSCSGKVIAADEGTGKLIWVRDLAAGTRRAEIHGQPAIIADLVVVPTDSRGGGAVYALDRHSGVIRWRSTTEVAEREGGFTTDVLVSSEKVITVSAGGELVAMDLKDGRIRWSIRLETPRSERRFSAALAGNQIYVTVGSELRVLDVETGKALRSLSLAAEASTSVSSSDNTLYVGLKDKTLRVISRAGEEMSRVTLPDVPLSVHSVGNDLLAVLTAGDELIGMSERGVLWRYGKGGDWSSPRFASRRGHVIAGATPGNVVMIHAETGCISNQVQVTGVPRGIAVTELAVIVGTLDGNLYRIPYDK